MTKKEIFVTLGIFLTILTGIGVGLFFVTKNQTNAKKNVASTVQSSQVSPSSDEMPLSQTQSNTQNSDPNSLTVVAGANTGNPGQLGSGQVAASTGSGNTSSSGCSTYNAPAPESFSQYEQYTASQGALTGDIVTCPNGAELKSGYKAAVYYKGWLTNGTLFDQSRPNESGQLQPFILTLGAGQVIKGWEQGLLGMKVGGTRRIIVPASLGYGAAAQGKIPANSLLIFDVQLLDIQAPQ